LTVGNRCPLTTALRVPSYAARCRHQVAPHPADSSPRQRRHGRRCDRAWCPGYSPRSGRARARSVCRRRRRRRRRALPPGPRIAGAARRPARGPAEAPSSSRPLGRRGHAPLARLVAGVRTRPTTTRDAPTAPRSPATAPSAPLAPRQRVRAAPTTHRAAWGHEDARNRRGAWGA